MEEVFISDEEVETYERKSDPTRRSVVSSVAAVAAAFMLIGGAYAFGYFGGDGVTITASLLGGMSEEGETFPLWSAGRDENKSFAKSLDERGTVSSGACSFESGGAPKGGAVLLSEIAWMGTEEGAQYEWIELANTGSEPVNIGGWSMADKDEQIQFVFPKSANIPRGGFILLARSADRVSLPAGQAGSVKADYRYTGNLKNDNEGLRLFNISCEVIDEVFAAPKWPAGESAERSTMERNLTSKAWHTSSVAGGTPKSANSAGRSNKLEYTPVVSAGTSSVATSTTTPTPQSGLATSSPASVGAVAVAISEVMAGKDGAGDWDFVELHNVGPAPVSLTGWNVKKRSLTGAESKLVVTSRLEGVSIPADGYLLLAHPDYIGSPSADVVWPKSYALAYTNNAVVLYNAAGVKVDEVSWMEIPKGQSYAEVDGAWVITNPTPKTAP